MFIISLKKYAERDLLTLLKDTPKLHVNEMDHADIISVDTSGIPVLGVVILAFYFFSSS